MVCNGPSPVGLLSTHRCPLIGSSTVTHASSAVRDLGVYMTPAWRCRATFDRPFRGASLFYVTCIAYTCRPGQCSTVAHCCTRSFPIGLLLQRPVWTATSNLIQRLQSVQHAAARLILRIRRSEHITPALISLHWLRVSERISFRLAELYDVSIHPRHLPSYSRLSPVFPTWHPDDWDDGYGLLPHIVWRFRLIVSL